MERFIDGDQRAFDALFARHAAAMRSYLQRLTGSAATADDLTQATFVSMVKGRGRFQRGAKVKPWLYAIATNAARDWGRRGKFEKVTDEGVLPEAEAEGPPEADPGLEKVVKNALAQLPEAMREAIVMHRFEGLSFAEIAEHAGVTESAVKVRAHRGYERLRELLKGVWP
ncbi:MAG: RNA polymerase sigma factor [Archangium gephyra]|uniref:RNA polymerase sigma factor n=1 Tax=Archangium gephyra TaxID=48 RepID=A0A2W5T691_9BACT|nr:MAG: RNA polymerase sigma factor [Archangium gephyra]